jgi:hypothetical protein
MGRKSRLKKQRSLTNVSQAPINEPRSFFLKSKGQYTIIGFIILVLTVFSLLFDLPLKIADTFNKLFVKKDILSIENEFGSQPAISPSDFVLARDPGYNRAEWEGSYAITNLTQEDITIFDFNIEWTPTFVNDGNEVTRWELKRDDIIHPRNIVHFETYVSQGEMYEIYFKEDSTQIEKETQQHLDRFPFTLKPGEKKYFRIDLTFSVYKNNIKFYAKDSDELTKLLPILIKAPFDKNGNCFSYINKLQVVLKLSQNRIYRKNVDTWLSSVGCITLVPTLKPK